MPRSSCFLQKLLFAVLVLGDHHLVAAEDNIDPMPSMVTDNGYPLEVHSTTTTDGYILGMHRIPYGMKSPAAPNKPVVLLMHHMYSTSYSFVYIGKDHSLGFILADAGYDVWMGNTRGNVYSRRNVFFPAASSAFWQFSWHERGAIDLPAMIDYILQETKQEKLSYVSLSRGGTMFFVLMSTLPEYNDKIKVAVNMAPSVFLTKTHSALEEILTGGSRVFEWILVFLGKGELIMTQQMADILDLHRCKEAHVAQNLCEQTIFLTGGFDTSRINKTKMADIAKDSMLGASVKELAHFAQLINSKRFSMYDYSVVGNIARYGTLVAPSYDLSKVTAPVVIISSIDDTSATSLEIAMLVQALPNLANHILIEDPGFSHIDFVASDDAKTLVYDKLLEELEKYSNV